MVRLQKGKKSPAGKGGARLLITVNVLGSAGPLRFLVNEQELVTAVITTALKSYAREGRLPVLGSDINDCLLYAAAAGGASVLSPWETIGSRGTRTFLLCKKVKQPASELGHVVVTGSKAGGSWKAWLNKSFNLKISSH